MSIDTYKLTSTEEPTDEVLSQLMREAAEEAKGRSHGTVFQQTEERCAKD